MAGVGIMPPNVLVTPYPWSSVMIRSTLGAPSGGTTEGGQYGLESAARSLITPPNLGLGGGSCLPSMVMVALVEPGVPVICWACAGVKANAQTNAVARRLCGWLVLMALSFLDLFADLAKPGFRPRAIGLDHRARSSGLR